MYACARSEADGHTGVTSARACVRVLPQDFRGGVRNVRMPARVYAR